MKNTPNITRLKAALLISLIIASLLFAASDFMGKNNFFLLLNIDLGRYADYIFEYCTNLGDGIVFIPALILFIIYRKKFIPLLVAGFIISTLITHLFKDLLMPHQPRPTEAIGNLALIHTVHGVDVHKIGSFPSGHTTTAFTIFFIACLMINKKWVIPVGLLYGLLVGYSRIYLAQHFPDDVAGGIMSAIVTIILSLWIQEWWLKKAGSRKPEAGN